MSLHLVKNLSTNNKWSLEVKSAILYMEEKYQSIRSVQEIAGNLSISYNTLRTKFRRETRLTLIDYLTRLRLKRALELFTSDKLLKEIAWEVGYSDENQFIRAFIRVFNKRPKEVRTEYIIQKRTDNALSFLAQIPDQK